MRVWIDIKDYKGFYQVSDDGFIRSLDRKVRRNLFLKTLKGIVLKQGLSKNGYAMVSLCKEGKSSTKKAHQLVYESFKGAIKTGLVIHHKDNDKLNNNLSNLEMTSRQKNTQEYWKTLGKSTGLIPVNDISLIKKRVNNGEQCYKIAKEYNVTRNDIAVLCKIIALTGKELTYET